MDEDRDIPILFGRAFLATCGVCIDMQKGELKTRVKNEEETFEIYKTRKRKKEKEEIYVIETYEVATPPPTPPPRAPLKENQQKLRAWMQSRNLHPSHGEDVDRNRSKRYGGRKSAWKKIHRRPSAAATSRGVLPPPRGKFSVSRVFMDLH